MYVCLCRAVTDGVVKTAIAEGAVTLAEVARRTSAGTVCGSCRPALEGILAGATGRPHTEPPSSRRRGDPAL